MLCLFFLLGVVGDIVEVVNMVWVFEGFWVWLLRGITYGREWFLVGWKVGFGVILMYRLFLGLSRWFFRICEEVVVY